MSLELYFSGAEEPNTEQKVSDKSLGGYISSSKVPNLRKDVLFGLISYRSTQQQLIETKGLFLKNAGTTKTNIYFTLIYGEDKQSKLEVAFVTAVDDELIEKISSIRDIPYTGTFYEPKSVLASALVEIQTAPIIGENITILGVQLNPIEKATKKDLADKIMSAFENNSTYKAIRKDEDKVKFVYKTFEAKTSAVTFSTDGSATINNVSFSGFSDGKILISNELLASKCIGIWFKRTFLKQPVLSNDDLLIQQNKIKEGYISNIEDIDIKFIYT